MLTRRGVPPAPNIEDERWFALTALAQRTPAPPRYPETLVDASVLAAFTRNPDLPWTPRGLAVWHGIHLEVVESTIHQLLAVGMVRANGHGSYVLEEATTVFGQGSRCTGTTR